MSNAGVVLKHDSASDAQQKTFPTVSLRARGGVGAESPPAKLPGMNLLVQTEKFAWGSEK